ncbi:hypothetical protein N7481_008902 [Penicillium waksmanii]|uniref:uncharacterized protein n=1 Tax=Penicillium waksmanii TaxID=69791 RepID=UPI00254732B4|nr:uncharacterized protein N7481_008902 [Penicillium waksmanii]KAJ5975195.1 hypothetical protein N7481_008902 [Penicillium waksmanii]
MPCFSGCEINETELIQSSRYRLDIKSGKLDCSGNTYASFYCSAFSAPPGGVSSEVDSNPDSEESDDDDDPIIAKFGDQAKATTEAGTEQVRLDIAVKLLFLGNSANFNLEEITTGLESLVEVFANRFIIKACSNLVEKEGKATIKAIENKLKPKRVTKRPTKTRPPKSSHTSARTRTTDQYSIKRADNPNYKQRKKSARTTTEISDQLQGRTTRTITLDCNRYPQLYWHYSSVISNNLHSAYIMCPYAPEPYTKRGAVDEQYNKHNQYLVNADIKYQADK